MSMTLTSASDFLKAHDKYLILTHKNPDGDTLGSAAALCSALRSLGKEAFVYNNPGITPRYMRYLDGMLIDDYTPECVVSVDIADVGLLPAACAEYADKIALAIDHHGTHRNFAEHLVLDANAAACGEIIYRLIECMGAEITADIAGVLYLAVSTDTGCFLYSNTTPETHKIAAELLVLGVDTEVMHRDFFITKTRARLTVEAKLIEGMRFYHEGKTAIARLPLELINSTQATEDDLDNISALARSIDGVELGILIRELESGSCKISARSGDSVNAALLCSHFGGGGHVCAAGCTIDATPDQTEALIADAIDNLKLFSN